MAHVETAQLSKSEHDELCCAYAALLLHDDGQEITGDKIAKVIKSSGNDIEPYWPSLFAKALKGQNIEELLSSIGSSAAVAVGVPEVAAGGKGAEKKDEKKKEEKKEEEPAADVDMGGLFGDEY